MADNVELDPGSGGAIVATDDAGAAGHVQIVKLAISADGSATVIGADGTNGLDVDVTRVQGTVTVDSELPTAAALSDTASNPTTPTVGAALLVWDSTQWLRPRGDTTNGLDVDVTRSALPSGASTSANQTTIIGHVDGIEGLLTTIDGDTGTVAGAVAGTEMQVDVVAALPAGNNNIGDVDIASAIPAGTNLIGAVNVKPATSGGLTMFRSVDLDETEEAVKGTAGQLFGWYLYNDGAAEVYVHIYNGTTGAVTVGSTTPDLTLPIPAGSAANVEYANGIAFSSAITAAATTAFDGTGAPATNQVIANFLYA